MVDRLSAALADRYRIERELGAGGMATVYLAADLKHDRKVAIKVLKPELAAVLGAERFVQEIKTTAALSHPHILPLLDSGEAGGLLYYVMPFIEGETIRDRLNRETQLGIDDAVKIATEVADALDYAHRHGVIHRDIKPENILLHDGRPMVMDFGIALAVSAAAGGRMTETGLSLGTPHYMSPEQATADKQITARSDIYSLASVLYEMLSGDPPHTASSAQAIIMKIIAEPVTDVTTHRKAVPANVAAALGKALEKLPADRFDSAKAFADALGNPAFTTAATATSGAPGATGVQVLGRRVSWRSIAMVSSGVAGIAIAAAVYGAVSNATRNDANAVIARAEIDILSRSDSGVFVNGLDMSPDGSTVVYSADALADREPRLYLRRLADREAHAIPGTEKARSPVFSPDGQSIAFVYDFREIRRIPVTGVTAESVTREPEQTFIQDLRWSVDGYIYYTRNRPGSLVRVRPAGGAPETLPGGDAYQLEPVPGGRYVLYTECCSDTSEVRVLDLRTRETQSLGVRAEWVRYLPTGHMLLATGAALRAVAFDARRATVHGEPFVVLDSITANGTIDYFAVSQNGTAMYTARPGNAGRWRLALVDTTGREERIAVPDANYSFVRFSPDGRRLAFVRSDTLWSHDLVVGTTTPLAAAWAGASLITWTRDGSRILYRGTGPRDSVTVLMSVSATGAGRPDTVMSTRVSESGRLSPLSFSPDGRWLLLMRSLTSRDLVVASWDSTLGPVTDYLAGNWVEGWGSISPDGHWVAYVGTETRNGDSQIFVRSFPEPGTRFTVSDSLGGSFPRWAPDGRTIFYQRGTTLVAATVRTSPDFAVTGRRDLFSKPGNFGFDVNPNRPGFVMPVGDTSQVSASQRQWRLVLVVNWLEEFRRKAAEQR